jgi:hypothetical protein
MKKLFTLLFTFLLSLGLRSQSCTNTVYYDNMETFNWFGDWFLYSFSNFYNNFSVSPSSSAVHYGSGASTSGIEQDWYTLPTITGLNPNYGYKVRFKLASYTATSPSAATRGVDADDFVQVQLSRNGSAYIAEMTIRGFSNQTWTYGATGIASKTANGTNTIYQRTVGGARADGFSTVELTLQPNTTSVAIDLYTRCNAAGEEFWIDNVELIETIPTQTPVIFGDSIVCEGDPITLTAVGGNSFSWSNGITNGVSFTPSITTNYTVTATFNGMINGNGTFQTCSFTKSKLVTVDKNCVLPIYLSSFTGENEGNTNHLYWVTEQEINSSHFDIERSKDGIDFYPMGRANANETNPYEFIDEVPLLGDNYYRLKMVDTDGSFSYSKIINIQTELNKLNFILFPNPISDILTYRFYTDISEFLEIKILNVSGEEVLSLIKETNNLINVVVLDLKDLGSGFYTVIITHQNGTVHTSKISKI